MKYEKLEMVGREACFDGFCVDCIRSSYSDWRTYNHICDMSEGEPLKCVGDFRVYPALGTEIRSVKIYEN